jgi:Crinkler effector protein N-terminal domain
MSLSLNCLVLGDKPERMFTVKIPKTDNVSILKKLINEKNLNLFGNIDLKNIDLWKVDLHMDELGEEPVHINLNTYTKLSPPWLKLSSVFEGTVDDERLHVITKAPGMSHSSSSWNLI